MFDQWIDDKMAKYEEHSKDEMEHSPMKKPFVHIAMKASKSKGVMDKKSDMKMKMTGKKAMK